MFGMKIRPPHCEHLTRTNAKLVQKILSEERYLIFEKYMKAALEKGLTDVLVAVAKNYTQLPAAHQEDFCEDVVFYTRDITIAAEVIPQIVGLNEEDHSILLALVLKERLTPAMRQKIVAMPLSSTLRAATALGMMWLGDVVSDDHISMLLMPPTNIHHNAGMLMKVALRNNRFQVAYTLRGLGFDLAGYASEIKTFLQRNNGSEQAHRYLAPFLPSAVGAAPMPQASAPVVAPAPTVQSTHYSRVGDTVSLITPLPNNKTLNVVFNFASAQQITFVEIGGQASAPTTVNFRDIADRTQLREAATAYVSQNGDAAHVAHILATRPLSFKPVRSE